MRFLRSISICFLLINSCIKKKRGGKKSGGKTKFDDENEKCSSQIHVDFSIRLRPFDVLPLDQVLDPLLDNGRAGLKPLIQLFHDLTDQLVMIQRFA